MLRTITHRNTILRPLTTITATTTRLSSSASNSDPKAESSSPTSDAGTSTEVPKRKKTMAELDDELKQKMSGLAGDGGEAGVEIEDGQPVSMKRSVKNNMFRYI
ncbi:hypothetical protein Q7P37_007465 [Cladosporium fusiforme]